MKKFPANHALSGAKSKAVQARPGQKKIAEQTRVFLTASLVCSTAATTVNMCFQNRYDPRGKALVTRHRDAQQGPEFKKRGFVYVFVRDKLKLGSNCRRRGQFIPSQLSSHSPKPAHHGKCDCCHNTQYLTVPLFFHLMSSDDFPTALDARHGSHWNVLCTTAGRWAHLSHEALL